MIWLRNNITMVKLLLIAVFSIQGSQGLWAGDKTSGILRNASSDEPVPFAHIFNESKRTGAISNLDGRYEIPASSGDTLVLSVVGYFSKVVFVPDSLMDVDYVLEPRKYQLDEVQVKGFRNYEEFKRQFLALELPKTETHRLQQHLYDVTRSAIHEGEMEAERRELQRHREQPQIPQLTYSTPILWKDDLQRMQLVEIKKQDAIQRVVDRKYNREIVKKVTQLPDEEITDFMVFCSFDLNILFKASDYMIVVLIEQKLQEYQDEKRNDESALPMPNDHAFGWLMS